MHARRRVTVKQDDTVRRMPIAQLPMEFCLRDGPNFANFINGSNSEARQQVWETSSGGGEPFIYLWGKRGTGRTHLLEAACHQQQSGQPRVAFVPLIEADKLKPGILDGLEEMALICIDDLDRIAGQTAWEEGLFHLCNRAREGGASLIWAGLHSPGGLGLGLPDLKSRLAAALVLHLRPLEDEERIEVLQRRATEHGFQLTVEAAQFLLRRQPRDMHSLIDLLERLDRASLAAQRRVTIPFIRSLLEK